MIEIFFQITLSLYHILVLPGSFHDLATGLVRLPVLSVLPPSAAEEKRGCGDIPHPVRRASRPPAPPAFPSFRVNAQALWLPRGGGVLLGQV